MRNYLIFTLLLRSFAEFRTIDLKAVSESIGERFEITTAIPSNSNNSDSRVKTAEDRNPTNIVCNSVTGIPGRPENILNE